MVATEIYLPYASHISSKEGKITSVIEAIRVHRVDDSSNLRIRPLLS